MAYKTLKVGSKGQEVVDLQNELISKGYLNSSGADGIYGQNTAKAVRDYQKANNLTIDGIAGNQTLTSLFGSASNVPAASTTGTTKIGTPEMPDFDSMAYDPTQDSVYQEALNTLTQVQQGKPTYNDEYEKNLEDIYNEITNREKFSYNINEDPLYEQYANQYKALGDLAMQDTMGRAASMTGGYANSFAQFVGQQAYQSYLQQLNDKVPELAALARQQYDQEGQDMLNRYSLMSDMRNAELSKYNNYLQDYWQSLNYYQGLADQAYNRGYTSSQDAITNAWKDYSAKYQEERNRITDAQWQKNYDLQSDQIKQSQIDAKLKNFDPEVANLQQTLKDAGLYNGDVDGLWSSSVIESVHKYNKQNPDSPIQIGEKDNSKYTGVTDYHRLFISKLDTVEELETYINKLVDDGEILDAEGVALFEQYKDEIDQKHQWFYNPFTSMWEKN